MSALEELSDFIEAQRDELFDHLEYLVGLEHWSCECDLTELVNTAFEQHLRDIDVRTYSTGMPWTIGITYANTHYARIIQQIEEELNDD